MCCGSSSPITGPAAGTIAHQKKSPSPEQSDRSGVYLEISFNSVINPMKILRTEQFLPVSLPEAWAFFATPRNLNAVTPRKLDFRITSGVPDKMYEGLFITYRIKPMLAIPVAWVTEITHIKEQEYFVDEQRKGPYRIWHHEHHFREAEGGVIMTDILYYDIGLWIIGRIAGALFVDRMIREIFRFRRIALDQAFPDKKVKTQL